MLDEFGFDQWSGEYDSSIEKNNNDYPFAGYYQVLSYVHSKIEQNKNNIILDLGIGTGLLSRKLYEQGMKIIGIDFSRKMLDQAQKKIPDAELYQCDFNFGLPEMIKDKRFDYIISSYAFHHISDDSKIDFIDTLKSNLTSNGRIIITDVGFENENDLNKCREKYQNNWDDDEHYIVYSNLRPKLNNFNIKHHYTQISFCAGILEIEI